MHLAFAVRARHARVHLRDHDPRTAHRAACHVYTDPEGAEAVCIRWAYMYEGRIEREDAALEEQRDLAQEDRHVSTVRAVHHIAYILAHEQAVHEEGAPHLGLLERQGPKRADAHQLHALHLGMAGEQGAQQGERRGGAAMHEHTIIGLHQAHRLFGRHPGEHGAKVAKAPDSVARSGRSGLNQMLVLRKCAQRPSTDGTDDTDSA